MEKVSKNQLLDKDDRVSEWDRLGKYLPLKI